MERLQAVGLALPGDETGPRRLTAASVVYHQLRDEIVSLKRVPGEVIAEKEIAAAHGLSRTPVREALLRLADEGLVEIAPKSGTYVSRIPLASLHEAMIARAALEDVTAQAAAEKASAADLKRLDAVIADEMAVAARGDHRAFHAADDALHQTIAEIAGLPGIWRLVLHLKTQVDRCRHLSLPHPGRMDRVIREHSEIVAAIAAHDVEAASAAMRRHVKTLHGSLGLIRGVNPDYFDADPREVIAG